MSNIDKEYYMYYIENIIFDESKLKELLTNEDKLNDELLIYLYQYVKESKLIDEEIRRRLLYIINFYRYKDKKNIKVCNEMIRTVNSCIDTDEYYFNQVITRNIDPMGENGLAADYCKYGKELIYKSIKNDYNVIKILLSDSQKFKDSKEFLNLIGSIYTIFDFFKSLRAIRLRTPEILEKENVIENIYILYNATITLLELLKKRIPTNDVIYIELKQGMRTLESIIDENTTNIKIKRY